MICGNKVGGIPPEKTYIITNEDESFTVTAVVVDEYTEFNACCDDVAAGKIFAGDTGVGTGTNTIPKCREVHGMHIVYPEVAFSLTLTENNMWDYTHICGMIVPESEPHNAIMVIMDDAVYRSGTKVANLRKDDASDSILFDTEGAPSTPFVNPEDEPCIIHYFICKEEA